MFVVVELDKDVEEVAVMRAVEVVLLVEEMLEVKGNIKTQLYEDEHGSKKDWDFCDCGFVDKNNVVHN